MGRIRFLSQVLGGGGVCVCVCVIRRSRRSPPYWDVESPYAVLTELIMSCRIDRVHTTGSIGTSNI